MAPRPVYKLLQSKLLCKGHNYGLYKDDLVLNSNKQKVVTRETIRHPGASVILPFIDKKTILLLRQFRYSAKSYIWEIPAGTPERGESPLICARRELEEETGFCAKSWKRVAGFYPAPGISDEYMTFFMASDLIQKKQNLDHDEFLEVHRISLHRAFKMVHSGLIKDAKTIIAILWACK